MRACVSGGAGMIGSHLVDLLLEHAWEVTILDALVPTSPRHLNPRARLIHADVCSQRACEDAVAGCDVVFHQAAVGGFPPGDATPMLQTNVIGTVRLAQAAHAAGVAKFVLASSQAVYGYGRCRCGRAFTQRTPTRESGWQHPCTCSASWPVRLSEATEPAPASIYGHSKLAAEQTALQLGREWGWPVVALRYALTYGPRQSPLNPYVGICALFAARLRAGLPAMLYEDGLQTRDFTYVGDVARANLFAATDPRCDGRIFNVGTGTATTVAYFTQTLARALRHDECRLTDRSQPFCRVTGDWRPQDARHVVTDPAALNELGWTAETSLRQGLAMYAASIADIDLPVVSV